MELQLPKCQSDLDVLGKITLQREDFPSLGVRRPTRLRGRVGKASPAEAARQAGRQAWQRGSPSVARGGRAPSQTVFCLTVWRLSA